MPNGGKIAYWSEWCDNCANYTPHEHVDTHTRRREIHIRHERDKRCARCGANVQTVEVPKHLAALLFTSLEQEIQA